MEDEEYEKLANKLLESIVAQIEENEVCNDIDVDYDGEILIIEASKGKYIINKHNAAKEIWMVSPISGPHHFHMSDEEWIDEHDEDILMILSKEMSQNFKINIKFTNIQFS
jgi:iron donor protein CyaY